MPRRSLRTSSTATPQKREAPATPVSSGRQQVKRAKLSFYSPPSHEKPKGSWVKESSLHDVNGGTGHFDSDSPSSNEEEASGYEDEGASSSEVPSAEDSEDEYLSDDVKPKRGRKAGTASAQNKMSNGKTSKSASNTPNSRTNGNKELWRPGVKTGLGAGTEVIIKKPKARPAGRTPYADDTIHPNTMLFLGDLVENNDREWLKMHDPDYRASLNDFNTFLESVQEKLVEVDDTIPELPIKDIIFRIYRDVRFSKDQTPYKTHFSAAWSRTGRKGPYAAYYLQIKPGGSFVGGGLWMPESDHLAKLRRNIDRKPHKIKAALLSPGVRKHFLGGIEANEKKAVKAFTMHNKENALKSKPRDFDATHRDIELLKLRNFTIGTKVRDDDVLSGDVLQKIITLFTSLLPFITYLNSVVMPDDPDSSDSEAGDPDEDNDEEGNDNGEEDDQSDD